jgi:hypothetical protein
MKQRIFVVGERKPGKTVLPPTAVDAETAAMTIAAAVEMRSDDFMVALRFDDVSIVDPPRDTLVTGR